MTAETKTSLARVCAVMVPEWAEEPITFEQISDGVPTLYFYETNLDEDSAFYGDNIQHEIEFPEIKGNWQILGELGHITEEQADLVIEHIKPFLDKRYRDYTDPSLAYGFDFTWQKGLKSLTDSMEVYAVNPYGAVKPHTDYNCTYGSYEDYCNPETCRCSQNAKWQRAQSRTGRYIILYEPIK